MAVVGSQLRIKQEKICISCHLQAMLVQARIAAAAWDSQSTPDKSQIICVLLCVRNMSLLEELTRAIWKTRVGADAFVVVAGYRIPVHTFVLKSRSAHLEYHLQRGFKSTGLIEYHVSHWPANIVWKALELIYLGDYSDYPSPLAESSDNIYELVLHCSIYMLARYWSLPESCKETPLRRFKQAVENKWEPYAFLDSVNVIFSHLPSATLIPLYPDYRNQISDSMVEDDIVQFVSQQIEKRRGEFVGERSGALFQCLTASPLLLSLVLDRWLAEGGVRS